LGGRGGNMSLISSGRLRKQIKGKECQKIGNVLQKDINLGEERLSITVVNAKKKIKYL